MALVNGELGEKEVVPEEFHVGREFCLQYYTVLTKNIGNIHRFYDDDSQMTRGSSEITLSRSGGEIEPLIPARGQREIHARMMEENLRNAKVKVLHFDVQKVAGDSQLLTIQVCGELTNDGGPMRRFMESFVLKRTDAKSCYVVNNIFRFQDQVFCNGNDDACASEGINTSASEGAAVTEPALNEVPISDNLTSQPTLAVASGDEDNSREVNEAQINDEPANVHLSSATDDLDVSKPHEVIDSNDMVDMSVNKVDSEVIDSKIDDKQDVANEDEEKVDETDGTESSNLAMNTAMNTANGSDSNRASTQSWASLVRHGIPSAASPKSPNVPITRPKPITNSASQAPTQSPTVNNVQDTTSSASNAQTENSRPSKTIRESTPITATESLVNTPGNASTEKAKFPDNVQVFVGNIPISMKSDVLKEFFNSFGEVVDVRINVSKSNGRLPNFGFVIFKSPETVQHVLTKRPIYIDSHRLNVEEKKPNGNRGPRQPVVSSGPGGSTRNGFGPRGPRRA